MAGCRLFQILGLLVVKFSPWEMLLQPQSDGTPDQRTGGFAHKDIARCICTVLSYNHWHCDQKHEETVTTERNWVCSFCPCHHSEHPRMEILEDGNDHTGKTHSNNSLLLSGAFQVPWRALSTKLSGVLHLHTALKGRRRCFHSTWATSSTAVSSLALSSSLHDQKCSQQSSPVRSTPSLKHFSSFNCSNVHRAKRSSQHIRCPCCYSSTLDRTGEDGLSTQQTCLQVLTTAGNKDRKYLQYGTRHAYIILCLIWPCCV